jgi:putative ABC transport system permease protein
VYQPIVDGRPPRSADEIVLGRDALGQIHKRVGDTVTLATRGRHIRMRVVGVSLQPTAGDLSSRLSKGGAVTTAALLRLGVRMPTYQFAVRYRPGADKQAAFTSLVHDFGNVVLLPYPGGEVGDLARVDRLPYVLAGLMVVLAIGALELTLVASVRRHRRDLAVLKSIGFSRHQVTATVAWQATLLAAGALLVGIPAGVVLGRWTWHLVAHGVGSVSPPIVPLAGVFAAAAGTLLIANVLAGAPGWAASRLPPAQVLRAE